MNHISLTIPSDDEKALIAGATMLLTLAGKIPEMELADAEDLVTKQERVAEVAEQIHNPTMFTKEETAEIKETLANTETPRFTPPIGPELDSDGLPWDARIHSGGKVKIGDGTWRKKKGIDKADYERVVTELKQLMATPVIEQPETIIAEIKQDLEDLRTIAPPPPPPADTQSEPVAPPPPATDVSVPDTFPAFLKAVAGRVQQGELTMEVVNAALPDGVVNLNGLSTRPDLIPQVWAALQ